METNTKTSKNTVNASNPAFMINAESQSIYNFLERLIEENKNKKDIIILPHYSSNHDFEKIIKHNATHK